VSDSAVPRDLDDLTQAQEDLARALGRARIGEDRALFDLVRELGDRLAYLLSGLLRMTRMHSPDNQAFDQPVAEVERTLVRLHETLGPIHLVAVEDQVYVNDIRIRTGEKDSAIRELGTELARHNVGEVTFHEPLDDAGVRGLVGALGGEAAAELPRTALTRTLESRGVSGLELHGRFRFRMAGAAQDIAERQDLVPRALAAVDEGYQNLFAGRMPNPLPLRRLVTELLEADLGAEELWIDPPEAPSLARHVFRVAHLSLLMGRAAGLPQEVMQDLGVAALYHDCGYAAAGKGAAAPEVSFAEHPMAGARLLMRQRGFHEAKTRRVLVALQHHQDANAKPRPGLFGRIVRIAEDYDTLSRRSGRLSPTMALAVMLKAAGTLYDTVLLQLFINALGAYPPGTLLRLEDGTVVRVAAPARGPDTFARPLARRLRMGDGSPAPPGGPLLDLKDAGKLTLVQPQG